MAVRLREALIGERIELKGQLPPDAVLRSIASELDPWRLGLIIDSPGHHDFIGWVRAPRFQLRQRHRFTDLNRYRPTVVGRVVPDGSGSLLEARFRADPWNRVAFLIVLALVASTASKGLGLGEILFVALILVVNVFAMELARRSVRRFLVGCMSEPVRSLHWAMS